ncbi:BMP family ABC transporter substrate-binding protein [Hamadaea sp. NPDC050747]|uniref:BMP family ABC transporter substrate-binding protein n=1 Tax=Hamadaea sp. NPDC050747 TaxID=3155789 RepID=UPI0034073ED6
MVVVLVAWWISPSGAPESPRARQYAEFTVCLLTDDKGIDGPDAAPVWASISKAAQERHVMAQYVRVVGEPTAENASTFLGGLASGQCDLLFAVGPAQVAAVDQGASRFPDVRFITVNSGRPTTNVSRVDGGDWGAIVQIVTSAAPTAQPTAGW